LSVISTLTTKGLTMHNLYWITDATTYEAGGNCPVDFVTLNDGRVLGIDGECVVLYESMDDFLQFETKTRKTISLIGD
jgi:hypothetical protein